MSLVKAATEGMIGFDVNQPISGAQAAEFFADGYSFCFRYIPRIPKLAKGNVTMPEIAAILGAKLALGIVQHTPLPGYDPSAELGETYAKYAIEYCEQIGLPKGINIFLDLEEVSKAATAQEVSAYCTSWYNIVNAGGWMPGLYVGYGTGLTDEQLWMLPFKTYWASYNTDNKIPNRGYCMVQHPQKTLDGITFDPNTIQADKLGGLPILLFPNN